MKRRLNAMRSVVVFALLGGCGTTMLQEFAQYEHPLTHDKIECEKPLPKGALALYGMYNMADAPALDRYSECKSHWEAQGYLRTGTREVEPSAEYREQYQTFR